MIIVTTTRPIDSFYVSSIASDLISLFMSICSNNACQITIIRKQNTKEKTEDVIIILLSIVFDTRWRCGLAFKKKKGIIHSPMQLTILGSIIFPTELFLESITFFFLFSCLFFLCFRSSRIIIGSSSHSRFK